mmetsp:Transcript_10050/g.19870  ORF Transcript_10050/g.19870 Transcript_10050/m.19870 type:complete len:785 (-) Transcript_10050:1101-3455(-)
MGACSSVPENDAEVAVKPKMRDEKEMENLLKSIPLLTRMGPEGRKRISNALEEEQYEKGDVIIKEGDLADKFYIIKEGKCLVLVQNQIKCELTDGEFFGEAGFVNKNSQSRRNATIKAASHVKLFTLTRDEFHKTFDEKQIRRFFPKRQAVAAASGKAAAQTTISKPADAVTAKTAADEKMIAQALKSNPLMKTILAEPEDPETISEAKVRELVAEMWKISVGVGKDIIKEGDKGDNFYIVISGMMSVYKADADGKGEKQVAKRGPGQSFGEIALMYNCARKATVRCTEAAELWAIDRYTFKRITTNANEKMLNEYASFLSKVRGFDQLTKYEHSRIAEALEEVKFDKSEVIIREGDKGDSFFILKHGHVVATKVIEGKDKEVMDYTKPGSYFGERAIIKDESRAATCTAVEKTTCLMLKRDVFELLLGPLRDLMNRDADQKYNLADKKGVKDDDDDDYQRVRTNFKGPRDFETIGILGKGSFGSVKLVTAEVDGQKKRFALKAVGKERVFSLGQQEHIMNERNIMLRIHHPFIVVLYQTFQDKDYLYFLLEPSLGGELFSVLRDKSYFKQDEARFFAASVVSVFEYLHSKDIIYRDLKPENLLLDERGYLKVTDFGFAKEVKDRTWTLCGTPDYLAPEIISSRSHGKGVDWWTLGILCYEMLVSYPPFYDQDPMKVYAKIMLAKLKFPKGFNKNAESLIRELLKPKPSSRLGVTAGGASKVKAHPWFKEFSFEALLARKVHAPIVQAVDTRDPLMNFEEYDNFSDPEEYRGDNKDFALFDSSM